MSSSSSQSTAPAWIGVGLAFYSFVAIGIAEGGLGVLLPSILATYQLTPATVTLLFVSQVSGYIVAALTSSLLSSRLGLARMLLFASAALTGALVIYALTSNWSVMVAAGTLLGLGVGLIDAGINTYIASDQRNANLMGTLHAFYGIGALLGPAVATTLLALGLGWQLVYLVFAAVVGLTVVGMLWAVWSSYSPMTRKLAASGSEAGTNLRLALRTPTVLVTGLLLLIYVGTEAALGNWVYSVETLSRGTPAWVAGYSVSAYWLGLTLGRLSLGPVVTRLGAVRTIDLSLGLLIAGLVAWWLLPSPFQLLSLPLLGLALAAIFPATIWLMPQRVSAAIVPAAIGFATSAASLGAATIPTAAGGLAERFGLAVIPVLMLPMALLLGVLHRWLVQHALKPVTRL